MGKQTFIEINGKKYDAITGKILSDHDEKPVTVESVKPVHNIGSVDGFSKRQPKPDTARTAARNASKPLQKSNTLMRRSVNKPDTLSKPPQASYAALKKKLGESPNRTKRSQEIHRSPHIQKFEQPNTRTSVIKKHVDLHVKQPAAPNHSQLAPALTHNNPATLNHNPARHSAAAEKLIEAALTNAESHNEKAHHRSKKRKSKLARKLGISPRAIAVSTAVLSGVLLGGFFAVQNVPNLAMRVAATRAGFDATLPGYQPTGFSFKGPVNYSSGRVSVTFKSNTDNRSYSLIQSSSNWSSDALLANYIVEENKQYQTYLDKGRTLYIYDGSNATWVDNGIWYQIEGKSGLTTDQLVRIASSI